jgi:hypothetical protein
MYLIFTVIFKDIGKVETYEIPTTIKKDSIPKILNFKYLHEVYDYEEERNDIDFSRFYYMVWRVYEEKNKNKVREFYEFFCDGLYVADEKATIVDIIMMKMESIYSKLYLCRVFGEKKTLAALSATYGTSKNTNLYSENREQESTYKYGYSESEKLLQKKKSGLDVIMQNMMMNNVLKRKITQFKEHHTAVILKDIYELFG